MKQYDPSIIDATPIESIIGTPEGTLVVIVETFVSLANQGYGQEAALHAIEDYRKMFGESLSPLPEPLTLKSYVRARIAIEHTQGVPMTDDLIRYGIQNAIDLFSSSPKQTKHKTRRDVPLVIGAIQIAIGIFFVVYFEGWWKYLVAGFFVWGGWAALKTGLFGSDKEIRELTEDGPVLEDTERKFKERLGGKK